MSQERFRFVIRNLMYLRNFQGAIRDLADSGHSIVITTSPQDLKIPDELREVAQKLEDSYRTVNFGLTQERQDWWAPASRLLRNLANLLHYRRPEYRNASALAARAERRAGPAAILFPRWLCGFPGVAEALRAVFRFLDNGLPPDKAIIDELKTSRVDALILTPMVDLETEQLEWVRAARAIGVPSCLLVASWDNLTNKGLVQVVPDRVVVWNNFQKQEAINLHRVPAEKIVVTGAQLYDEWFERKPSRDYESFCRDFGFDPKKPTILYCGSSIFIARDEVEFVKEWLEKVRTASDPKLRTANILVRPHPMHQMPFDTLDTSRYERVAVHPKSGGMPVLESNKADFFDALFHASLVVGINTSALIEAAILGKRSFSVDDPRYRRTQEGTLHFHYLVDGGILKKAPDFETHLAQMAGELNAGAKDKESLRTFIEQFIRPLGLEKPATAIVAETVAGIPKVKAQKPPSPWLRIVARIALSPLAALSWLFTRAWPATLDLTMRVLRFGLFAIAGSKRCDAMTLVARRTPVDYPRSRIVLLVTSPRENVARRRSVMRQPWTVHWLERVVGDDEVLYDVGANVGAFSLVAAKAHDQDIRVFAFEPSFVTYASLCRNVLENGCDKSVTPLPIALTDKVGNTVFRYRSLESGGTRHAVGRRLITAKDFKQIKPAYAQRVLAFSLDSVVEVFQLDAPNHIRVDVGGGELEVLQGAAGVLTNGSVKSVLVNASDADSGQISEYMKKLGFGVAAKFDRAEGEPGFHAIYARDAVGVGKAMATQEVDDTREKAEKGSLQPARGARKKKSNSEPGRAPHAKVG